MAGKSGKAIANNAKEQIIKTKMVAAAVCESCKEQCQSGKEYLERMSIPGTVGRGAPCSKK